MSMVQTASAQTAQSMQAKYGGLYAFAKDVTVSNLAEERTPQKLIRLTNKLERLAEREIAGMHEQISQLGDKAAGILPVCRMGCWHCCTHMVLATVPEILNLAEQVCSTWNDQQIAALRERILVHKAQTATVRDGTAAHPPRPICPLLEEGGCSVWQHRPFICRGWNSIDVEPCIRKREHPEEEVREQGLAPQFAVADYIRQGLSEGLEAQGANSDLCELAYGLEIALDHPDAAERYLAGEDLFAPARQGMEKWA
jgi:hypothetical protein